jgi:SAM-dependent methyltransferase
MDLAPGTVRKARLRARRPVPQFLAADARGLPLRTASLDLVLSTSTLDHFDSRREFVAAISEIARVLRPGGRLVLTIDNPSNPLYWPLRWLGRTRWVPFPFGYSPSGPRLREMLADAGLEVIACETLIHNPRIVSTVLFLALRRLLHSRADRAIRGLLAAFEVLERLPTRGLTACFLATCAVRSTMPPHDSSAPDVLRT